MATKKTNPFELYRDNKRIRQMREDVEAYKEAIQRQAALEQAQLKEQNARELDTKAKSINDKPFQTDKQKK